jgi:hypothetical protein
VPRERSRGSGYSTRMTPIVRRAALVLALAPFVAAGAAAAAAPKASVPKSAPSTSPKTPKLEPVTAAKMALVPPATKEFKAATARAAGIEIDPGDLKAPVRMTVRQPSADAFTALAFVEPEAVSARGGDGIARMGVSVPLTTIPYIDGLAIMRGDFRPSSVTLPAVTSSMGVVFRASADRVYVVTCAIEGDGRFDASILEASNATDATKTLGQAQKENGHVGTVVLAAPRLRDLTVQFTSDAQWSSSACEITPVG